MRSIDDLAVIIPNHNDIKVSTPNGEASGDLITVGATYHRVRLKTWDSSISSFYFDLYTTACGQRNGGEELAIIEKRLVKGKLRACRRKACL